MWQSVKKTLKILSCVLMIGNVVVGIVVISTITQTQTPNNVQTRLKEVYSMIYENMDFREQFEKADDVDVPDLQFLNLLKPVVHFSGLDLDQAMGNADREKNLTTLRNWANPDGSDRKLLYNGMSYENGSITVPAAGVYHITSHVKFYIEDNRKDDKPLQTFRHQVVRYSASSQTQVVLFENAVTECKEGINDGAHLEYPSDAGGLAQLDAGDNIIVKVSHLHPLKHDRDWHLVDMYLV
ncbi:tumor necrosis factor-like isoform X2 [Haliotis rubra]|uniref:tumor necrosis factor-like isoform X2 n=1 Tax=Haliotis rubra TaxID=36100 RepID=UPI001EE5F7D6|nr:tumor necrosis factor-like isoform X2 [Haliotis rubra]